MSKQSRANLAARAMEDAATNASILIEACENRHRLNHQEALDVLCNCVCKFLFKDGNLEPKTIRSRCYEFGDQLVDFVKDVFDVDLSDDGDSPS